jgi:hypothetical protein
MRSIQWISAALLALGTLSCAARAQAVSGLPGMPPGYDWSAYAAPPCQAPPYGTYGSVVPGTYDCPSCCLHVWNGFCQKKAMQYEKWSNSNCGVCTGETPCVRPRCASAGGWSTCAADGATVLDPGQNAADSGPVTEQPAPPKPLPEVP